LLFNFQGALSACPVSRDSLYIISLRFCFVKGFLKVFSNFFQPLVSAQRVAQSDPYIISLRVPFVKRFLNFFEVFAVPFGIAFLSRTAQILYYTPPLLSIPFCEVFQLFPSFFFSCRNSLTCQSLYAILSTYYLLGVCYVNHFCF